jgi:hypothetical protein
VQCIANARVGPASSMWNTRNKDFGPRIGFAYDLTGDGRMSLHAGWGISFDRIFDNVWSNGAWNPPFYALIDLDASGANSVYYSNPPAVGAAYVPNSVPSASVPLSLRTMQQDLKDSSAHNFFASLERQFGRDYLIRVNYQGSLGRHLPVLMNLNRVDGLRYNANLTSQLRPNPLYNGFNYRANNVSSNYNALVAEVQKRYHNGLQFQGSFTWSKLMDYGSELFSGETSYGSSSQPYYFVSNAINRKYEYGPGAFDHTKSFKLSFVYDLPFLKSQKGVLGQALGGWSLSSFYQAYSGHPLEIYENRTARAGNGVDPNGFKENIGGDFNLDQVANDRPTFYGTSFGSVYSGGSPAEGIFKDNNPMGCTFPGMTSTNAVTTCRSAYGVVTANALFGPPAGYGIRFGNLGRNTFRGPAFNAINAGVHKSFRVTERMKLEFRADAINAINHANFEAINTNVASTSFGRATKLAGSDATETGISRRFQFGARLHF